MYKAYAGIGSRETPAHMLEIMSSVAHQLSEKDWLLRSGNAKGADQAFQRGAPSHLKEVHLPWDGYNNGRASNSCMIIPKPVGEVLEIAATHHPAWDKLSSTAKLFMIRNTTIVLGEDLLSPVKMVVCWTPNGKVEGGTGHAMRLAASKGIPIFNLHSPEDQVALSSFVGIIEGNN
jgi:hypothetical protein